MVEQRSQAYLHGIRVPHLCYILFFAILLAEIKLLLLCPADFDHQHVRGELVGIQRQRLIRLGTLADVVSNDGNRPEDIECGVPAVIRAFKTAVVDVFLVVGAEHRESDRRVVGNVAFSRIFARKVRYQEIFRRSQDFPVLFGGNREKSFRMAGSELHAAALYGKAPEYNLSRGIGDAYGALGRLASFYADGC